MAAAKDSNVRGDLRFNEPMHKHTTWRVGGPADVFFRPSDLDDLVAYVADTDDAANALWVGLGSNLLVRDGGYRGVVIATHRALSGFEQLSEYVLRVGAGEPCAKVAKRCATLGIGPAEFFAGIPGTVGGALAMNAGAFDGETWRFVREVETLDAKGTLRTRPADEFAVGYRSVEAPAPEWFVSATCEINAHDGDSKQANRELRVKRKATQPIGEPSCGSVFRNPPGDFAARLIEATGLKGLRVGGAQVSPMHANFIVNTGDASASDIEALLHLVRSAVADRFDVWLHPEVRIVGEFQRPDTGAEG
ncbi:MAG: UDP-N-acetylmuramate dehydrogenase [Pseudomonadota bacterium]